MIAVLLAALVQQPAPWPQHAMDRPRPARVDPGPATAPAPAPADAIRLFDGKNLARWRKQGGGEATWTVRDGYMEVAPGSGGIETVEGFGDAQLHVEWMAPLPAAGSGQNRGNSGVFLMGRYEVQILDSHDNDTYPDGQAAAVYGQFPPLVNATRAPGQWQSYDIVFRRPRFSADGRVVSPARMTVLHNGVLVHDAVELLGPTSNQRRDPYVAHPDRLPVGLQDHAHPVRFRNIWVRDLEP
jgi:hypothetical protein